MSQGKRRDTYTRMSDTNCKFCLNITFDEPGEGSERNGRVTSICCEHSGHNSFEETREADRITPEYRAAAAYLASVGTKPAVMQETLATQFPEQGQVSTQFLKTLKCRLRSQKLKEVVQNYDLGDTSSFAAALTLCAEKNRVFVASLGVFSKTSEERVKTLTILFVPGAKIITLSPDLLANDAAQHLLRPYLDRLINKNLRVPRELDDRLEYLSGDDIASVDALLASMANGGCPSVCLFSFPLQ